MLPRQNEEDPHHCVGFTDEEDARIPGRQIRKPRTVSAMLSPVRYRSLKTPRRYQLSAIILQHRPRSPRLITHHCIPLFSAPLRLCESMLFFFLTTHPPLLLHAFVRETTFATLSLTTCSKQRGAAEHDQSPRIMHKRIHLPKKNEGRIAARPSRATSLLIRLYDPDHIGKIDP